MNLRNELAWTILLIVCSTISWVLGEMTGEKVEKKEMIESVDSLYINHTLTNWQVLELAIMKTESDFNPTARGNGALGLFQITEVFVEECNRLLEEPKWVHTDAFVPERALEMFNFYQAQHNPKKDYIRAINAHNPGGESIGYSQRVLANMDYIRNYERLRSLIVEFEEKKME